MGFPDWLTAIVAPGPFKRRWQRFRLALARDRFIRGFSNPADAAPFLALFDENGSVNRADSRLVRWNYLRAFTARFRDERLLDDPEAFIRSMLSPDAIARLDYGNAAFVFAQTFAGSACYCYRKDDGMLYLFAYPLPDSLAFLAIHKETFP